MLQKTHIKKIDSTDTKILSILEKNGRTSFVDIAKMVGLSQTPCSERIKRLERDGYIQGYSARLNPKPHRQRVYDFHSTHFSGFNQ